MWGADRLHRDRAGDVLRRVHETCIVRRVRLPALLLIAACGGSAAPSTKSTTALTTPSGEEDWRGYLAQIAGPPCAWLAGSSFLACTPPDHTTLIGWEAANRRYVAVRVSADAAPAVLPGNASNAGWAFEGPDGHIAFTRAAKGWTANGLAASDVEIAVDPKPAALAAGTLANHSWTFTAATVTTLTRQSPLEYKLHIEAGGKVILDGSYTTKPVE